VYPNRDADRRSNLQKRQGFEQRPFRSLPLPSLQLQHPQRSNHLPLSIDDRILIDHLELATPLLAADDT
jgi:hypothetical protein